MGKDRELSINQKKVSSIAGRIHAGYWFNKLWAFFCIDIVIAVASLGLYFYNCEYSVGSVETGTGYIHLDYDSYDRNIFGTDDGPVYQITEDWDDGETYSFYLRKDFSKYKPLIAIVLAAEGINLFFSMFGAGRVRKKLKPLNDLAVRAEQISKTSFEYLTYNEKKMQSLEQAIDNVSATSPNARISTGDRDLQSIEIAINNLITRMRESQKQQNRFVSDASHELRTPIAVIQGYVNMLDRWGKEDESVLDEAIEALKNESEHMKELIEQLLFLARGDSGRNTLNKVDEDLNDLMQEIYEESVMIDDKHEYEVTKADIPCVVNCDVVMMKQSARIFIQNAMKYTPEKGMIKIKVERDLDRVAYIIQDEGIGMNDDDVQHIFERFYRSDKARNGESGGTGLGLSIAKWIVDAHEGKIDVLSSPEIGTRFTVSFPVGAAAS